MVNGRAVFVTVGCYPHHIIMYMWRWCVIGSCASIVVVLGVWLMPVTVHGSCGSPKALVSILLIDSMMVWSLVRSMLSWIWVVGSSIGSVGSMSHWVMLPDDAG